MTPKQTDVLTTIGAAILCGQLGERATLQTADVLRWLESMPEAERAVVFQVLHDYFCPRCGREQPPGDCQC